MRSNFATVDEQTEFSHGYDRGNYAAACESEDWESWYDANDIGNKPAPYIEGVILGFFSSYELHEISDEIAREDVRALREKHGDC